MTILDRHATAEARDGKPCIVARTIASLGDEDAAAVTAALASRDYSARYIAAALTRGGHRLSASAVVNHRAPGLCSCPLPLTDRNAA